jgi:hypothetical protein
MIRMLGVLCGAAIAIGLLTWLVGVPQFTSKRAPPAEEPLAVVTLPAAVEHPVMEAAPADPEEAMQPAPGEEMVAPVPRAQPVASAAEPDAEPGKGQTQPDPRWFAFWTPFRSEIAANGFVSRLQSVTGLDYRVVRIEAGVYEVAFAYDSETEIESKLAAITAATGLELAGLR